MTEQLAGLARDDFMEAAQQEMIAFERKEREFRKRVKQERADELHMLELKHSLLVNKPKPRRCDHLQNALITRTNYPRSPERDLK
jgi:hypothetical protein